jgi:hypothetical protein
MDEVFGWLRVGLPQAFARAFATAVARAIDRVEIFRHLLHIETSARQQVRHATIDFPLRPQRFPMLTEQQEPVAEPQAVAFKLRIVLQEEVERDLNVEHGEQVRVGGLALVKLILGDVEEVRSP